MCSYGLATPAFHSISIDSRYAIGTNSNEAVGNFGLEFFNAQHFAFDWATRGSSSYFSRSVGLVGFYLYSAVMQPARGWMFSFHEYGHGGRYLAVGADPIYLPADQVTELRTNPDIGYRTFLPFFVFSLLNRIDYGATAAYISGLNASDDAVISMAGMNNSTYFSEIIEERILEPGGSFLFYFPWIVSKLDAYEYSVISEQNGASAGDDVAATLSYYTGQGFGISHSQIRSGVVASILLNPSLYYFLYSAGRFIGTGLTDMEPPRIGRFFLPRLHQYFTSAGLSFKVISGWEVQKNLTVGLGVEHVYVGDRRTEYSGTLRLNLSDRWSLDSRLVVGRSPSAGISGAYRVRPWRLITGADLYHPNSLYGERHAPTLSEKIYSMRVWTRVLLEY